MNNKKVSIIGDSISTFDTEGYKYQDYTMYYPTANIPDVTAVSDTWWYKLINTSGAKLEVNASYSGSAVTTVRSPRPNFYDRCSSEILGNPDVIIVALGTNDSSAAVEIGNFDYDTPYANLREDQFIPAYIKGIKALRTIYPNADIVCVALHMDEIYARMIKRIANTLGCIYVSSMEYAIGYTIHPNAKGMQQIVKNILKVLHYKVLGLIPYEIELTPVDPLPSVVSSIGSFHCRQSGYIVTLSININLTDALNTWTPLISSTIPAPYDNAVSYQILSTYNGTQGLSLRFTVNNGLEARYGGAGAFAGLITYVTSENQYRLN